MRLAVIIQHGISGRLSAQIIKMTEEDVMRLRSLGRKSFKELKEKLLEHGLEFENTSNKDNNFSLEDEGKE